MINLLIIKLLLNLLKDNDKFCDNQTVIKFNHSIIKIMKNILPFIFHFKFLQL